MGPPVVVVFGGSVSVCSGSLCLVVFLHVGFVAEYMAEVVIVVVNVELVYGCDGECLWVMVPLSLPFIRFNHK